MLFLPPPPEHPPPSDIGTPPDSPTHPPHGHSPASARLSSERYGPRNPMMHSADLMTGDPVYALHGHVPYSDGEYGVGGNRTSGSGCNSGDRSFSPRSLSERRTQSPHYGDANISPPNANRPPSPTNYNKCRTMSPLSHLDSRAYSPRAMSEPERGPTPPVRAYKLIPLKDHDLQRHYSDGEAGGGGGAPMPPIRMIGHNPPSPAPEDPMMDRACQSSLPSLVSECINR